MVWKFFRGVVVVKGGEKFCSMLGEGVLVIGGVKEVFFGVLWVGFCVLFAGGVVVIKK